MRKKLSLAIKILALLIVITGTHMVFWPHYHGKSWNYLCVNFPEPRILTRFLRASPKFAYCYNLFLRAGHKAYENGDIKKATYGFYTNFREFEIFEWVGKTQGQASFHFAWGVMELHPQRNYTPNNGPFSPMELSALLDFAPAMNNLGQMYYFGINTKVDKKKAFEWHLKAAEAGNPVAMANVRIAYELGEGVEKSQEEAEKWKRIQFSNTNPLDLEEPTLERTLLHGNTLTPEQAKSFREAAKQEKPLNFEYTPTSLAPFL